MKKRFFIPACIQASAAMGFGIYAVGHPEFVGDYGISWRTEDNTDK